MSGYPGGGYPGSAPAGGGYPGAPGGGYPGGAQGAQGGGYPGAAPPGGGYPGAPRPGAPGGGYPGGAPGGGYPGSAPPSAPGGGYPGSAPQGGGYPGAAPQGAPGGGYPGGAPGGGYPGGAPGGGYPGAAPQGAPGGGYPGGPMGGAPPVDPQIASWFNAVDQDRSGQIDANELKQALANGDGTMFSEGACRMMIEMFDRNLTGTIDIQEFGQLFQYINQMKGMFEGFDKDRTGTIDQGEFTQALQQMQYRFTPTFTQNLVAKYNPRGRRLTLDNFIILSTQIKRLTDSFRTRDREMRGQVTLAYEDFIGLAIGAHK